MPNIGIANAGLPSAVTQARTDPEPTRLASAPSFSIDPSTVMRGPGLLRASFLQLVARQQPEAARDVAQYLLDAFGPYSATNSEENRRAIIDHLLWLAGTGIRYDYGQPGNIISHAPNETVSTRLGVCKDTHLAVAAILSALMNARSTATGYVLGEASGREADVQMVVISTANENHALTLYRDPRTGGWNAIEYGTCYELNAPSSAAAMQGLLGTAGAFFRVRCMGFDRGGAQTARAFIDNQALVDFLTLEPGVGTPGDSAISGGPDGLSGAFYLPHGFALTTRLGFGDAGVQSGGLMSHFTFDGERGPLSLRVHLAAGLYYQQFELSAGPGRRAAAERTHERQVIGLGRLRIDMRANDVPLRADHLRLSAGLSLDLNGGIIFNLQPPSDQAIWDPQDSQEMSAINLATDLRLSGRESVGRAFLSWSAFARLRLELIEMANEFQTSSANGHASARTALHDAWTTGGQITLGYRGSRLSAALDLRANFRPTQALDPQLTTFSTHALTLSVCGADERLRSVVSVSGNRVGETFSPVTSVAADASLRLRRRPLRVGVNGSIAPRDHGFSVGLTLSRDP